MPSRKEGNNKVTPIHEFVQNTGYPFERHIGVRLIEIPPFGEIPNHEHDEEDRSFILCLKGKGRHLILEEGVVIEENEIEPDGIVMHRVCKLHNGRSHSFEADEDGLTLVIIYNTDLIDNDTLLKIHEGKGIPETA